MPIPIPEGKQITVQLNHMPADFTMPSVEISTDHYNISYVVSGDRRAITPDYSFSYHTGDVAVGVPLVYHRTVPESSVPYVKYQIKFTFTFAELFKKQIGRNVFDEIFGRELWYFPVNNREKIEFMFREMLEEYQKEVPYKEAVLQGMLFRLITAVYENKIDNDVVKFKSPLTEPILEAIYFMENNYSKNITLESIAEIAHFSASHFSRVFHSQLGIPFREYLANVRIRHAKRLLIGTNRSVMEIALDVGYLSGDYLSAQFKSKTGVTPTQFRKNLVEVADDR